MTDLRQRLQQREQDYLQLTNQKQQLEAQLKMVDQEITRIEGQIILLRDLVREADDDLAMQQAVPPADRVVAPETRPLDTTAPAAAEAQNGAAGADEAVAP